MMATGAAPKKRLSPRVAIQGHLRYRPLPITVAEPRNAMIAEVGRGGLRFRSDELLNCSSSMLLEMHLPDARIVHSLARVVWVKAMPENDGYEIGGMFVEPTHETRATLERIVAER